MKVFVVGTGHASIVCARLLVEAPTIVDSETEADLIVVGPEVPFVAGYADEWRAKGKLCSARAPTVRNSKARRSS